MRSGHALPWGRALGPTLARFQQAGKEAAPWSSLLGTFCKFCPLVLRLGGTKLIVCSVLEGLEIIFKSIKKKQSNCLFRNKGHLYYFVSLFSEYFFFWYCDEHVLYSVAFQDFFFFLGILPYRGVKNRFSTEAREVMDMSQVGGVSNSGGWWRAGARMVLPISIECCY